MKKIVGLATLTLVSIFIMSGTISDTTASAATPPDTCFAFDAATGTITDYYNNQNNDAAQPACPKDVDIPTTIGGVAVTTIGNYAFYNNQLTTVTIPNSVTTIGSAAFAYNQLTTITIPNSVTTIGNYAFYNNQLTTVTIPNSVTIIGDGALRDNQLTTVNLGTSVTTIGDFAFYANQLTTVTIPNSVTTIGIRAFALQNPAGRDFDYNNPAAYTTIYYARLYTADPSNPNNLQDDVYVVDEATAGYDANGDGDQTDIVSDGGHLINPSSTTTTFKDQSGATLAPNQTITGQKTDNSLISDYLVVNGPTVPAAADPYNPTPAEQQAQRDALKAYYRLGSQQTFTAPQISGYTGPVPASPYTTTLAAADNTMNFVYTAQAAGGGTTPSQPGAGQGSDSAQGDELADTGFNVWWLVSASILLIVTGVAAVGLLLRRSPGQSKL